MGPIRSERAPSRRPLAFLARGKSLEGTGPGDQSHPQRSRNPQRCLRAVFDALSLRGPNIPGEPKLAAAFWNEIGERLVQEEMDRIDLEDARAALKEAEEKGTVPHEEVRKRLGL